MSNQGRLSQADFSNDILIGSSKDDVILNTTNSILFGKQSNAFMYVSSNVGVGTTVPSAKLHIIGDTKIDTDLQVLNQTSTGGLRITKYGYQPQYSNASNAWIPTSAVLTSLQDTSNAAFWSSNSLSNVARTGLSQTTHVASIGVGTSNPSYPVHVIATQAASIGAHGYLRSLGDTGVSSSSGNYSIYAAGRVAAAEFNAFSDARIKANVTNVDSSQAQALINRIFPKEFTYIDTLSRGSSKHYGFIAQELEAVVPHATSKITDFIPNIYEVADTLDSTTLRLRSKSFDLGAGARLKLVTEAQAEVVVTVVAVLDSETVQVSPSLPPHLQSVFVFGQQVDDFTTINTDAVVALLVGAVKEVSKKCVALQRQYDDLVNKGT